MIRVLKAAPLVPAAAGAAIVAGAAVILWSVGQPLICRCGSVKLWMGEVLSAENSQHLVDWYSPSHFIHGLLFYGLLWLVARRQPVAWRAVAALVIETAWEILENSPIIIDRYRAATISLGYSGDSVINSLSDLGFMLFGFALAARLPLAASILLAILLELFVGYAIRDNLTLNILMLLYPLDSVRAWQQGG